MTPREKRIASIVSLVSLVIVLILSVRMVRTLADLHTLETAVSRTTALPTVMPTVPLLLQAETATPGSIPTTTAAPSATVALLPTPLSSTPTTVPLPTSSSTETTTPYLLYLSRNWSNKITQIRLLDPAGGAQWLIGSESNEEVRLLDWSTDGVWALLSSHGGTVAMSVDGSQERRVVATGMALLGAWSPTAQQVALVTFNQLLLVNVDSGQQQVITLPLSLETPLVTLPPFIGRVSWSPDGTWFAWQMTGMNEANQLTAGLYRYVLASDTVETIYEDHAFAGRMQENYFGELRSFPAVAPDGQSLLTDLGGQYGLYRLSLADGQPSLILRSYLPPSEQPQWSPDGAWIAAVYHQDIYLIHAADGEAINLTNTPTVIERQVTWSPDGRFLAYAVETVIGTRELALYDVLARQSRRLTHNALMAYSQDDAMPLWGVLTQATTSPPLPTPIADPAIQTGIPMPPSPIITDGISLEPPPSLMDPPWWGNRFLYRRPLVLDITTPISAVDARFSYPPLVQVTFDPVLIRDRLEYPVRGYDVRVVSWRDGDWQELPRSVQGLDGETAVLTFPLSDGTAGTYYLYYGSQAPLQRDEGPPQLGVTSLGRPDITSEESSHVVEIDMAVFYPLLADDADLVINGAVTWENDEASRPVANLASNDSLGTSIPFHPGQGMVALFVKPDSNAEGRLLSVDGLRFDGTEIGGTPLLLYEDGRLQLSVGGQVLSAPITLQSQEWFHIMATWQVHEALRLWVNGQVVAEMPYTLTADIADSLWFLSFSTLHVGAFMDVPGMAGNYKNLFVSEMSYTATEAMDFYLAQTALVGNVGAAETAVTTSTITADGGSLRSPDGRTWVVFPPGALAQPTIVSFAALNPGENDNNTITRFALYPEDVSDVLLENPSALDETATQYTTEQTAVPFLIFSYYDVDFVEWADTILIFYFDNLATYTITTNGESRDLQGTWVPFTVFLAQNDPLALGTNLSGWGAYVITK